MENTMIKVYDIKTLIEKELPNRRVFRDDKLAIVQGTGGVVVFDCEAVGAVHKTINEVFPIELVDNDDNTYIIAQYLVKPLISDLLFAAYEEMDIKKFVVKYDYNSRLKSNFSLIQRTIEEIT
jgi:hypothetical protein